jgi:hypothetical protein
MATESLAPICFECQHYKGIVPGTGFTCKAFGENTPIPIEIMVSSADHHEPYEGDNGILFEPMKTSLATDPPESEAQRKAMFAAAAGHSTLGIPEKVGEEYVHADPGGKLPSRAKDMSGGNWKMLVWLWNKFLSEESQEKEHQEPAQDVKSLIRDECVNQIRNLFGEFRKGKTQRDERNPHGELSEAKKEEIGTPGSKTREDLPESEF